MRSAARTDLSLRDRVTITAASLTQFEQLNIFNGARVALKRRRHARCRPDGMVLSYIFTNTPSNSEYDQRGVSY